MNHKKIILVGFISAFVAILTSVMGVTGTIIGSVISSVLYNMLTEALDNPVSNKSLSPDFEWDMAYVFPLVVIALIQLLLIAAFLSQWGILPGVVLKTYLILQNFVSNNLYRVLGFSLLVMSIYPFVLKPDFVKKSHGFIIGFIGFIFLARGLVDIDNRITNIADPIFAHFDFPIAVFAFLLLVFVIFSIFLSAGKSELEYMNNKKDIKNRRVENGRVKEVKRNNNHGSRPKKQYRHKKQYEPRRQPPRQEGRDVHFKKHSNIDSNEHKIINQSVDNIQFESNDLLDDYKK